jgi:hypothetical protein
MNTPTAGISKFLDQLIRLIFDKHARSTTIMDAVDLLRRLETYVENDYMNQFGYHKLKDIPLDTFRKLARIVITENVFIYEKKFYLQIIGGAMGSAFTARDGTSLNF